MAAPNCPADQDLLAFHLGNLPPAALDTVASHLETCQRCEVRLTQMDQKTDAVVAALRVEAPSLPPLYSPVPGDSAGAKANPGAAHLEDVLRLLAPPQQSGEIGWLAHYRIERLLGQGGMGLVFEAEDLHLQRRVALKVMKPRLASDFVERQRFLREARAMAAVRDDHIVTVYQVSQDRDLPYLAMELLDGQCLERGLEPGQALPLLQAVRIGREVAEGLAAAHARGLIHRDIKPANIWLETKGKHEDPAAQRLSFDRVKILDFGLARAPGSGDLTSTGVVVGTPAYMAPEQAKGEPVDGRADLFSLGCVLYRLCTGDVPFHGTNATALMIAAATEPFRPTRELNNAIPPALAEHIERLLAKPVADRPVSARVVTEELAAIERSLAGVQVPEAIPFATPASARPFAETPLPRAGLSAPSDLTRRLTAAPARRRRWPVLVAASLLAGLTLGGVLYLAGNRAQPRATQQQAAVPPTVKPRTPRADDAWFKKVAAMPPREQIEAVKARLKDRNPKFDPAALTAKIEDAVVDVTIHKTVATDLSPPRAFPALKSVNLLHMADGLDLAGLQGLPLRSVDLRGSAVSDLTGLAGMNLDYLECTSTKVGDLKPLQGMKTLKTLYLANSAVRDLTPLAGLELERLSVSHCAVEDLKPLAGMKTLRTLHCDHSNVRTLGHLDGLPLSWLECQNTLVQDLTPLKGMPLTILDVSGTRVREIGVVKGMPLEKLHLAGAPVRSLEPLAGSKLVGLDCAGSAVEDLTPLAGVPLGALNCADTPVRSLVPLAGSALKELFCQNCKIVDLSPLKDIKQLRVLSCDFDPKRDKPLLKSLPTLETINRLPVADFWKQVDKP